jgi:hypothetical protein
MEKALETTGKGAFASDPFPIRAIVTGICRAHQGS